jgi:3-oxoacyl-[acyl-carrier-protein] synthase II
VKEPRVFVTAVSRLSAPLDGSGVKPDAALGGRLSARVELAVEAGETRLQAMARQVGLDALRQAPGLAALPPGQKGVFLSASKGGMEAFQGADPQLGPLLSLYASQGPGQALRQRLGWTGPGRNTPLACATGAYSLGLAFEEIRAGRLQAALAGAAEASLTPLIAAAFHQIGALSPARSAAELRGPFDAQRGGFVLGEGAAALLLESEASLALSGSRPVAELCGWACTCDAWHLSAPEPQGSQAARSLRLALEMAGLAPEDIAYVNAHGTGTVAGDAAEARALQSVFGRHPGLKISSVKGATGHTLGAAGAIEAAVCIEALDGAALPANVACRTPMPPMETWLLREPQALQGDAVMALSMGFGGHNVAWVFRAA